MARLNVTWGEPRRVITYPAAPENLSKLFGVGLAGAGDLAGDARQDQLLAALLGGAGDFVGGPLVTEIFNLSAALAAAVDVAPGLRQEHLVGAALEAGAAAGVSLVQNQFFAAALAASGTLAADILETHALGAQIGATSDAASTLELAFDLTAALDATGSLTSDIEQGAQFLLQAALDASADIAPGLEQEHRLGSALEGFSRWVSFSGLDATLSVGNDLAASMAATADLTGDVDAAPAGNVSSATAVSYTGNGSTQSITGVGFQPDLIIIFETSAASPARAYIGDRVALGAENIFAAAASDPSWFWFTVNDTDSITSYDTDGFTLGSSDRVNEFNFSYVALCFKIGDQVDVIDKSNTGAAQTVSHGLSTAPVWAIVKQDDEHAGEWLDGWTLGSEAADELGGSKGSNNDAVTAVSASDITFGDDDQFNPSSGSAPLYLFGSDNVAGTFHTGTYTGTGGSGNAITGVGFTPSFVIIRAIDGEGLFVIHPSNTPDNAIEIGPDRMGNTPFTLDADGFTLDNGDANVSGNDYRYFAWV